MPIVAAVAAIIAWLRALTPLVKVPLKIGLLVAAFLVIPVPEWASTLPAKVASMPSAVSYMFYVLQLGFGVGAMATAYALRTAWGFVSGAIKGS